MRHVSCTKYSYTFCFLLSLPLLTPTSTHGRTVATPVATGCTGTGVASGGASGARAAAACGRRSSGTQGLSTMYCNYNYTGNCTIYIVKYIVEKETLQYNCNF